MPKRVGQVVVAADDVAHLGIMVVDDDRQHVCGGPVGAEQDHVVEFEIDDLHLALHPVRDHRLPVVRHLEAYDGIDLRWGFGRIAVTPSTVVARGPAIASRRLAHLGEFFGRRVTVIRAALGEKGSAPPRHGGRRARTARRARPSQSSPSQRRPVDDGLDGLVGGAGAIGVLDAKDEPARLHGGARTAS